MKLADMRVLVVGLGQIGGSLALELTSQRLVREVIGFDVDGWTLRAAKRRKIIDRRAESLSSALRAADLIVLAAPIRKIVSLLPRVAASIRPDAVCLDVAGTKQEITRCVERLHLSPQFIGGHPIAGTERCGLEAAEPGKFAGCAFVLVPTSETSRRTRTVAAALVQSLGARPLFLSAREHDRNIALTSHLPYALSMALVHLLRARSGPQGDVSKLIGGSFRSAVRVAASPPELTVDMLLTNRAAVSSSLVLLTRELSALKRLLNSGDERLLRAYAAKAERAAQRIRGGAG